MVMSSINLMAAMRDLQFDPFGEPLVDRLRDIGSDRIASRGSVFARRLGVGLFWGLVLVIVAMRVAYFNPDYAKTFSAVAARSVGAMF